MASLFRPLMSLVRWAAANPHVVQTVVDVARTRTPRSGTEPSQTPADLAAQLQAMQARLDQSLQNQQALDDAIRRLHRALLAVLLLAAACLGILITLLVR